MLMGFVITIVKFSKNCKNNAMRYLAWILSKYPVKIVVSLAGR